MLNQQPVSDDQNEKTKPVFIHKNKSIKFLEGVLGHLFLSTGKDDNFIYLRVHGEILILLRPVEVSNWGRGGGCLFFLNKSLGCQKLSTASPSLGSFVNHQTTSPSTYLPVLCCK